MARGLLSPWLVWFKLFAMLCYAICYAMLCYAKHPRAPAGRSCPAALLLAAIEDGTLNKAQVVGLSTWMDLLYAYNYSTLYICLHAP